MKLRNDPNIHSIATLVHPVRRHLVQKSISIIFCAVSPTPSYFTGCELDAAADHMACLLMACARKPTKVSLHIYFNKIKYLRCNEVSAQLLNNRNRLLLHWHSEHCCALYTFCCTTQYNAYRTTQFSMVNSKYWPQHYQTPSNNCREWNRPTSDCDVADVDCARNKYSIVTLDNSRNSDANRSRWRQYKHHLQFNAIIIADLIIRMWCNWIASYC